MEAKGGGLARKGNSVRGRENVGFIYGGELGKYLLSGEGGLAEPRVWRSGRGVLLWRDHTINL